LIPKHKRDPTSSRPRNGPRMPNLRAFERGLVQELGAEAAKDLIVKIESRYAELYADRTRHAHRALRSHLEENILPGLALYQTLRAAGHSQESALAIVDRVFEVQAQPGRRIMALIGRLPMAYRLLHLLVRKIMDDNFPAEGWETEWVEVSPKIVAFNLHRCFYLDTLTAYGAPELTASFCRLDDLLYEGFSPHVQWARTTTLGRGDDCCDFRFIRVK
jgi:hypothetical protein